MSDEAPGPPRRRSPHISAYKTVLVRSRGPKLDRNSPEFQEHLRLGNELPRIGRPPVPDYLRNPTPPVTPEPPAEPPASG